MQQMHNKIEQVFRVIMVTRFSSLFQMTVKPLHLSNSTTIPQNHYESASVFTMTKAVRLERIALMFQVLLNKVSILNPQQHSTKNRCVVPIHLAVRQKE